MVGYILPQEIVLWICTKLNALIVLALLVILIYTMSRFKVFPNPVMDGNFNILYLLPQNQPGKLEVFDINGRRIYEMNLPHWSTMQEVNLPKSISSGVYNCVITSGGERGSAKVVVYKE